MPPRPPGYDRRPGTASSGGALSPGLPSSAFPRPPMSPNKRPYQYPPPPPGPPPGQPGYFQPAIPPLPPRPATSSPHLGPRDQGRVYSPPVASPTTPGSPGFPLPPPPPRSPQPYSYTPANQNQSSRMTLQGEVRMSPSPSPTFVTPQETPLSSSVPNSPPPPYSAMTTQGPGLEPGTAQEQLRSPSVGSIPSRVPSPSTASSAPISPLPQPGRVDSIRVRPSLSQRTTGTSGSRTPISPSAAADNLDALLQSLSMEFRIPSPATANFPPETESPGPADTSSTPPLTSPAPLEPRKSPRSHPKPSEAGKSDEPTNQTKGRAPAIPTTGRAGESGSPPASPPYPVNNDGTPAQPALPLFMDRFSQPQHEQPSDLPKVYKAYRPQAEETGSSSTNTAIGPSKQYMSYNPSLASTNTETNPAPEPQFQPESKASFGPLRPVTMLFDPYQQQRAGAAQEPPSVTRCIDSPVIFATDWYWHPDVPEFLVCSRCYVDHIFKTKFRSFFESKRLDNNGTSRVCKFRHPRMRDHLFQHAVSTGSMNEALDWMQARAAIPDCSGMMGVRGVEAPGLQWYKLRQNDDIPGFICCQACYEDRLMCFPQLAEAEFVQSPPQQPQDHWACDMATPYLQREYERCIAAAKMGQDSPSESEWRAFCREARARMAMPLCGGYQLMNTYRRTWFVPDDGDLSGLVLCQACYCDSILHSGQESRWHTAPELSEAAGSGLVRCGMGVPNIRTAMNRATDTNDFEVFWATARQVMAEKFCDPDGIAGGKWFSLKPTDQEQGSPFSNEFHVCGACRAGVIEVLQMADLLEPVQENGANISPIYVSRQGQAPRRMCSINPSQSRFAEHLALIYEAFLIRSAGSLASYASKHTSIAPCPKDDTDVVRKSNPARKWYGWYDCTVCQECFHGFVVQGGHDSLTSSMELHNQPISGDQDNDALAKSHVGTTMCELYSPRMRNLFASCAQASPPDPAALLHFSSAQRRLVYMETVPQIRDIMSVISTALEQKRSTSNSQVLRNDLHRVTRQFQYIPHPHQARPARAPRPSGTKSLGPAAHAPVPMMSPTSLGHGFAYRELLVAAQHESQLWATVLQRTGGQAPHVILGELEKRWRSVE
ncbi:uncharacterized protein B0I36DRAFT_385012 [Microdochium trichocladiopsis]|uniref:Integral membrane protein n=1 Tax=Microdochium trichocladiopsis TaxID=1682393 RepID=A0A9P8Y4H4_9PEZI|nr:uncharacterized protein B0I36DRAFT_385012 [Microdochium trichocladiopsis]KAH7029521.1 hypothetical protein B0I36DRAFT_385012 [Microdochium trichocladiopsis]